MTCRLFAIPEKDGLSQSAQSSRLTCLTAEAQNLKPRIDTNQHE
jgi:hypothetical protein